MPEARTTPGAASSRGLTRPAARTLEVYVGRHCLNCADALRLAEEAAARFPHLVVRLIDLEREATPPPEGVVAVPTYVFDGRVVALGNPDPEELFARLRGDGG